MAAASQYWTYRRAKASRELGLQARPHEETLEATVDWYLEHEGDRIVRSRRSQQLQYRAAGALWARPRASWEEGAPARAAALVS